MSSASITRSVTAHSPADSIDVKDAYSTDAKIEQNDLVVLEDELHFFPKYEAVFLLRSSMRLDGIAALRRLEGTLDEKRMIRLNAEAERTKNYARAADVYFGRRAESATAVGESFPRELAGWTLRHLQLAGFSLLLSVLVGIPLGSSRVAAARSAIRFLVLPALCKRFPRSPCSPCLFPCHFLELACALRSRRCFFMVCCRLFATLPPAFRTSRDHCANPRSRLGLSPMARLWEIYLPMASRSILSGIKTSAVINIGTATLAALIGAGGLGEPILSGLNLNDHVTILEGAIPAAVLALLCNCFSICSIAY